MMRHIEIRRSANGFEVVVDDWEVFDYVDDWLTVHGLGYESMSEEQSGGRRKYVMHFAAEASEDQIKQVLVSIPAGGID